MFSGGATGINSSANALALNTYFKEKRRIATGFSWTVTALGPIIFPHIIAYLMPIYGVQGVVLLFSGLALNSVAFSLIYQPVEWHSKKKAALQCEPVPLNCQYCSKLGGVKNQSLFSSQYLHNCDNSNFTGYEIIDPGTPMMSKSNDGWYSATPAKRSLYSSRMSLASTFISRNPSNVNLVTYQQRESKKEKRTNEEYRIEADESEGILKSNRSSYVNLGSAYKDGKRDKSKGVSYNFKIEEAEVEDCPSYKAPHDLDSTTPFTLKSIIINNNTGLDAKPIPQNYLSNEETPQYTKKQNLLKTPLRKLSTNSFHAEKEVLKNVCNRLEQYVSHEKDALCNCINHDNEEETNVEENYSLWQKIFIFFDLDLLKDLKYVNLMVGITIANFAELNYSILTPFVLHEYGLAKPQIATSMSLLGAMDISVRFFVPFIAGKIGWENKTFFLFGVLGMALGRVCMFYMRAIDDSYNNIIFVFFSYSSFSFIFRNTDCFSVDWTE